MCDDTPDEINGLLGAFIDVYPHAEFGPAHIVLSDGNLRDSDIDFCLAQPPRKRKPDEAGNDWGEDEAVRHFLRMLKAIPAHRRGEF